MVLVRCFRDASVHGASAVPEWCILGALRHAQIELVCRCGVESCHKVRLSGTTGICGLRQPGFTSTPEYVSTHPKCVMVMS